jgi:spore coat protein A, manganese oxidase
MTTGRMSRREVLRLAGAVGAGALVTGATVAAGSALPTGTPDARVLPSAARLPRPFQVPLPIPTVARPSRTDATTDYYDVALQVAEQEILPGLRTPVWGYAGQFPGPTLSARSGRRVVVRHRNDLPVPAVTHLHGGRTPAESDGYPTDLVLPTGGDFRPHAHDPKAKVTRGTRVYDFPVDQRAATLWYHDHRMDYTGPAVWRGLAGFFLVRDDEEEALGLPAGDKDVPLMICDRSFAADGTLQYPALDRRLRDRPGVTDTYAGGVLGDVILVNGAPWPDLEVARTRYRLRLLNASNARRYALRLEPEPAAGAGGTGSRAEFVQIGTDGGLLERPVRRQTIVLAPGERADVVVDFAAYRTGGTIVLTNAEGEGGARQVMRFRVGRRERDESRIPSRLGRLERLDPARAKVTRSLRFESGRMEGHPGWKINGQPFDPTRVYARPRLGDTEIWRVTSDTAHPVHLHLAHFQVLSVDGDRSPDLAWKDTLDLRAFQTAEIIARFDGYQGRYVFHCHNLEHEDMAMMGTFEVV